MPHPKLFLYKADCANIVAILRRGSHRDEWELIQWDMNTDTFTEGQWLKHKSINGKYAAISPDGRYFAYHYDIYPTVNGKQTFDSHGVVSRLPNFTALYFKDNFGGNWSSLGFDANGGIVYSGMKGNERLEKKGEETIPLVDWRGAVLAPSGYIKEESLVSNSKDPFLDCNGRIITVDGAKILANNDVIYDTTNHVFVERKPI
jgi:hypothetical protein